ncbi:hypothetical protein B0J13DRAFT_38770 [Dactylonectria estremocensis]|uniref:DUF1308 domain-containing protein n=1 Tax=Dactylonectria estremocensis TaxID=1079267 RepID=A0A9P9FKS3_9HYPO|nr:hypothetical protein B0J13DRAFT_38770 [Dactylonectria estremocensis]
MLAANMAETDMQDPSVELARRQSRMLDSARSHAELVDVCVREVEALMARLQPKFNPLLSTGLPTFVRTLQRELVLLQDLVAELAGSSGAAGPSIPDDALKLHDRRLEASANVASRGVGQWERLKRSRRLVAVNQAFQGSSREDRRSELARLDVSGCEKQKMHRILKEQGRVEVDVVAGGREWLAAKTVQRDRLARQMTDCGWAWGEHELGDRVDDDEWDHVPLAKYMRRLVAAARMNRHEYRYPTIRLILSSLSRADDEIDIFLDQLVHIDPLVQVILEYQEGPFMSTEPPPLDVALDNLVGDELEDLTPTLNLDHTILIDLISDLTHSSLEPQLWQAPTTRAQIEEENRHEGGLMARTLYPVLADRRLVCTSEAAEHFHYVLQNVGTETERERARLLVPWGQDALSLPTKDTRDRFQQLSIHHLPDSVKLPIEIIPEPWDMPSITKAVSSGVLPRVALDVAEASAFKSSKLSIFIYGWAARVATVTSNKEVRRQVRAWVKANAQSEDDVGPLIWTLQVTRNLLAKNASPRPGWHERQGNGGPDNDDDDNE